MSQNSQKSSQNPDTLTQDPSKPGPKGIRFSALMKTAMENPKLSLEEIGSIHGISKQAVSERLTPFKGKLQALKDYSEDTEYFLLLKEQELLDALDPNKMKKAGVKELATAYGIISDKRRLEQGKSTSNQATQVILRVIREDGPILTEPEAAPPGPEVPISTAGHTVTEPQDTP